MKLSYIIGLFSKELRVEPTMPAFLLDGFLVTFLTTLLLLLHYIFLKYLSSKYRS
jgi:hypothetical protein